MLLFWRVQMSVPKPVENLVHVQPLPDDSRPAIGPTALPRPLTPFVGRERPLTDIVALLQDSGVRLLTLTGPGGVGKTRLALAAAEALAASFRDGIVFVPLATVVDSAMVIPAIAAALEINDSGDRPLLSRLARELSDRRMLLVLDN